MENKTKNKLECSICEKELKWEEGDNWQGYLGDEGTEYEGKPVCEVCHDEDEPLVTIQTFGDVEIGHQGVGDTYYIGAVRNWTDGDFIYEWKQTDGWRGYAEAKSDTWEEIHDDTILAYSDDAKNLEDFDEKLGGWLQEAGIPYARVIERTSNLFSQGYGIWVRKEDKWRVNDLLTEKQEEFEEAKKELRDPEEFAFTSLTGASKKKATETDKQFVKAASLIVGDESEEELEHIGRAVKKDDKEALTIFGLRKVVHDTTEQIQKDRKQKRSGKITIIFNPRWKGKVRE